MTTDPIIAQFASQNDLELLETPNSRKRQPSTTDKQTEIIESELEADYNEEQGTQLQVQLTAAKTSLPDRIIEDIVRPEIERPIKVKEEQTRPFEVEIKRGLTKEKNITGDITQVWASRERETRQEFKPTQSLKKIKLSRILKKTPLFFVGGTIIVLLLILYSTLGSARVIIKPQKQALNFQIKASASSVATEINFDFNRIPGQRFGYKDEESDAFAATGQKDVAQKASGEITIYNRGLASQRLVATTRFESPDGLIFRIPQTITIPAAVKVDAALLEGSVKSIVYADRLGQEYNIAPAKFTIPGFKGTPKFEDFYAKSDKPMAGGIIGPSKVVTEEDFAKAQEAVTDKLKEKILRSLKDQAGELKILDTSVIKFDPPVTNAKVGEATENLQITIKGAASTLAFRESDALELVRNYVSQKGDLELLEKNLTINYLNPQNNADGSIMTFDIQVTGQAAKKIDQDKILKDVAGMKEGAIRSYFAGIKEIESARITLSPFWVTSIPKDPSKVRLVIEKE